MRHAVLPLLLALLGLLLVASPAQTTSSADALARAVVSEAAGRLDDTLAAASQSAVSLGEAYAAVLRDTPPPSPQARARLLRDHAVKDGTVALRDPDNACGEPPATGAPCPSLFFYDGERFTDNALRELAAMRRLTPVLAATHDALPFSWVYLTTPGQSFVIYPALALDEAVHNHQPTQQVFYTAADFAGKRCGWQSPYLDLAGAGMMVTVSCPVYDGDALLGVASRDITLAQLSKRVMADLEAIPGARAVLVNRRGKAIAASDPKLAARIAAQNARAGDAVVHFRADRGLIALGKDKYAASSDEDCNQAVELVLEQVASTRQWPLVISRKRGTILAARLETTGWYLILLLPDKGAS